MASSVHDLVKTDVVYSMYMKQTYAHMHVLVPEGCN